MTGPVVLLMAAVMGATAAFCAGRLALAPFTDRATDRGVDALHVAMGVAMVAMLLGLANRSWDVLGITGFGLAALWFLRAGLVSARRSPDGARASRHELQHGAGCLAMVAMLVAGSSPYAGSAGALRGPATAAMGGMPGMAGIASGGGLVTGGALLVVLAVGVLALASADLVQLGRGSAVMAAGRPALAPRCASACRVTMSLTMGIALLTML